jgi:hypothetical protein
VTARTRAAAPPPDTRPRGVLSFDAAWGGVGWSAWVMGADKPLPLAWGFDEPGASAWRDVRLQELLAAVDDEVSDCGFPVVWRVVVERAPWVYGGEKGNQFATGYGLGNIAGRIAAWGLRPTWGYPWFVAVDEWRAWYGLRRVKKEGEAPRKRRRKGDDSPVVPPRKIGRGGYKRAALDLVTAQWPHLLTGLSETDAKGKLEGPAVDVAEGALLGAGALLHLTEAPKGPKGWIR